MTICCLILLLMQSQVGDVVPEPGTSQLPTAYRVLDSPADAVPWGEAVATEGGWLVPCQMYKTANQPGQVAALWDTSTGEIDLWPVEKGYGFVSARQWVGDELVVLLYGDDWIRWSWTTGDNKKTRLDVPDGWHPYAITRLTTEGKFVGRLQYDATRELAGAVWSVDGALTLIRHENAKHIYPKDSAGDWIVGEVRYNERVRDEGVRPFIWTQGQGLVVLPVPEGCASAGAVAVNEQGAVLVNGFDVRHEGERYRRGRDIYVWDDGAYQKLIRPEGVAVEAIGMSRMGHVLIRSLDPANPFDYETGRSPRYWIVSLGGDGPLAIPGVGDKAVLFVRSINDVGVIVAHALKGEAEPEGDGIRIVDRRGMLLVPIYDQPQVQEP